MMTFTTRYVDNRVVGIHLGGGDFERELTVSLDFFAGADGLFCAVDRTCERFTIYADEGAATYQIVGPAEQPASVLARLVYVIRPCPVCKLRAWSVDSLDRHHWWCPQSRPEMGSLAEARV